MSTKINFKDKKLSLAAIFVIVFGYASERMAEIANFEKTKAFALAVGGIMSVLFVLSAVLIYKSKNITFALLASVLGLKMMPPGVAMLSHESLWGSAAYFIVCKVAVVVYVLLAIRFYYLQRKPRAVKPLPILSLIFVIPFFNEIASASYDFFLAKTGSMLGGYLTDLACYAVACVVILIVAYKTNYASMHFVASFEFIALAINILKRFGAILANVPSGRHISRVYYLWIILYVVLILLFALADRKKRSELQ